MWKLIVMSLLFLCLMKICAFDILQRQNNYNQGGRRLNGRFKARREDSVKRTVYVSDIDQHVSKNGLNNFLSRWCSLFSVLI